MLTDKRSCEAAASPASTLKHFAKNWIPPVLWRQLRYLSYGEEALYKYVGPSWPKDAGSATGWDDPFAVETMEASWENYRRMAEGTAPWDRRPWNAAVPDHFASNDISSFALALLLSAQRRERISVLDWGGAFGHYSLIARTLLPTIEIEYTVKERRSICAMGARLNPGVSFTSDDERVLSRQYDLVVAAGSLQYSQDWRNVAARLSASAAEWLLVSQLPITEPAHPSFVVTQRLRRARVAGDGACWIFDKQEVVAHLQGGGLTLLREFLSAGPREVAGGPANSTSTALLFRRA